MKPVLLNELFNGKSCSLLRLIDSVYLWKPTLKNMYPEGYIGVPSSRNTRSMASLNIVFALKVQSTLACINMYHWMKLFKHYNRKFVGGRGVRTLCFLYVYPALPLPVLYLIAPTLICLAAVLSPVNKETQNTSLPFSCTIQRCFLFSFVSKLAPLTCFL